MIVIGKMCFRLYHFSQSYASFWQSFGFPTFEVLWNSCMHFMPPAWSSFSFAISMSHTFKSIIVSFGNEEYIKVSLSFDKTLHLTNWTALWLKKKKNAKTFLIFYAFQLFAQVLGHVLSEKKYWSKISGICVEFVHPFILKFYAQILFWIDWWGRAEKLKVFDPIKKEYFSLVIWSLPLSKYMQKPVW